MGRLKRATLPLLSLAAYIAFAISGLAQQKGEWRVYFSPSGGATAAITAEIVQAKSSILIQAYSFTSKPIAEAIVNAAKRGVAVKVILDKSNETAHYSAATFLTHANIPVLIDYLPSIAHSKVMIIDNDIVITGSFNFTKSAEEKNIENLLIVHDGDMASRYKENWDSRAKLSRVFRQSQSD